MEKFLHEQSEIYNLAYRYVQKAEIPINMLQSQRVSVRYQNKYEEVIYTVIFQPIFNDNNQFLEWDYVKMEMYVKHLAKVNFN